MRLRAADDPSPENIVGSFSTQVQVGLHTQVERVEPTETVNCDPRSTLSWRTFDPKSLREQ